MYKIFNITNCIDKEIATAFCSGVLKGLIAQVSGYVSVMVVNGAISIDIINGNDAYRFICDDIMKKIYMGVSSGDVVKVVMKMYKKALIEDVIIKHFC